MLDGAPAGATRLRAGADGLTVVEVDGTPPRLLDPSTVVLTRRADGALETTTTDGVAVVGVADGLDLASASAVARRLAPLRLAGPGGGGDALPAADLGLLDLLGVAEPDRLHGGRRLVAASAARPAPGADRGGRRRQPGRARPQGVGAQDGMGPHGLLIGATGSGKSELLRTLVLGLAATHSSEDAQRRAGRLQGRRDVREPRPAAAHRRA